MSNQFGFIDIILLAMFAGFIILRLRNILGRRTGHQERPTSRYFPRGMETLQDSEINDAPSNGLENFTIDEESPNLFDSDAQKDLEEEFTSFEKSENSEEDDLEIPAFLRRQKN